MNSKNFWKAWHGVRLLAILAGLLTGSGAFANEGPDEGPAPGPYISVGGGFNISQDYLQKNNDRQHRQEFSVGGATYGAAGYRFGYFRVEGEYSFRDSPAKDVQESRNHQRANTESHSFMANSIFEPFPTWKLSPYIGGGVGLAVVGSERAVFSRPGAGAGNVTTNVSPNQDVEFAYQGIAGARYSFNKNWSAQADYRFLGTLDPDVTVRRTSAAGTLRDNSTSEYKNHALMFGLTYHFNGEEPKEVKSAAVRTAVAPVSAAAPSQKPASLVESKKLPPSSAALSKEKEEVAPYIIYFGYDSASLSNDAIKILSQAYQEFRQSGLARIQVDGHADRAGEEWYNQQLSDRRAKAAADYFISRGVKREQIEARGYGERQPAIPTPDGSKESRNRRAEVFLKNDRRTPGA